MDWEKEIKKLKSYEKVDDVDLYSNYNHKELTKLKNEYSKKCEIIDKELTELNEKSSKLRKDYRLINGDLGVILKRLEILELKNLK